jgi:signal transduction histidine kinase
VDDQGPGVPPEERERVWEAYYRLQRETASAVAGSGIGLTVVRSLAAEMGGRAWVEEADAGGARFVVELASGEGGAHGNGGPA